MANTTQARRKHAACKHTSLACHQHVQYRTAQANQSLMPSSLTATSKLAGQKKRAWQTQTSSQIHAACLHTMPACGRHVRYQQAPHGANTTPISANVSRIHCKHRARKKHAPLASGAPASSIASLHNACRAQTPQHPGQHAPGTIILPARLCSALQPCTIQYVSILCQNQSLF